jgi:hypothetical protein
MPFEQGHLYDVIPYDPAHGYPGRWGRWYRCPICGDIIPSSPPTSMACGCGNLLIEVGRLQVKHPDRQPELLKKKNVFKRLMSSKKNSSAPR